MTSTYSLLSASHCRANRYILSLPVYTIHKINHDIIRTAPSSQILWSLFCANNLPPLSETVDYAPRAGSGAKKLVAATDAPPSWSKTLQWVPLIGTYLNILIQAQQYFTPLEYVADFIAQDLNAGLKSEFAGKRVGLKVRSKSS